jgi:predicted phosphodiesterase
MKLHVLSDLHLNVEEFDAPVAEADVIVLAGDIARPAKACDWAQQLRQPVIYVAGNHEFYGGSIDGTVKELRTMCAGTNVHLLETDEVIIDGVRFLGTTLWTDFLIFGEGEQRGQAMEEARTLIRDFSRIRADSSHERAFSPEDSAVLFRRAAAWLQAKLTKPFDGPTVVVTHHAPSARSIHPRFLGSLLNACFVSDAEYLLNGDCVDLWIHGHTHDTFDYVVHGTRVVCNPRGYAKHGIVENVAFDSSLVVTV